ncbi:unnamed protein product [Schistocephalus solidus]|uniref:SH3 domain-containing protein n=1 Tax=Schistocephalus solidus TaxID=70667 RepID=A0A183T1P5_SCHSO|nr:unnamed protein product [Schistocephalus solidus]
MGNCHARPVALASETEYSSQHRDLSPDVPGRSAQDFPKSFTDYLPTSTVRNSSCSAVLNLENQHSLVENSYGQSSDNASCPVHEDGGSTLFMRSHSIVEQMHTVNSADSTRQSRNTARNFVAIFDYQAHSKEDLSVRRQDRLVVLDKSDSDWWLVENPATSCHGYVPSAYLAEEGSVEVYEQIYAGGIWITACASHSTAPTIHSLNASVFDRSDRIDVPVRSVIGCSTLTRQKVRIRRRLEYWSRHGRRARYRAGVSAHTSAVTRAVFRFAPHRVLDVIPDVLPYSALFMHCLGFMNDCFCIPRLRAYFPTAGYLDAVLLGRLHIPCALFSVGIPRWYFREISRKDSERLLLLNGNVRGTFLVRESETTQDRHLLGKISPVGQPITGGLCYRNVLQLVKRTVSDVARLFSLALDALNIISWGLPPPFAPRTVQVSSRDGDSSDLISGQRGSTLLAQPVPASWPRATSQCALPASHVREACWQHAAPLGGVRVATGWLREIGHTLLPSPSPPLCVGMSTWPRNGCSVGLDLDWGLYRPA